MPALATTTASKAHLSLFDCEAAGLFPREDWLSVRIPHCAEELVTALMGAMEECTQSVLRFSGSFYSVFELRRTEIPRILAHPGFAGKSDLFKQIDTYAVFTPEHLLQSYVTAEFTGELAAVVLQQEGEFARGSMHSQPHVSRQEVSRYVEACQADKQRFLRPFIPYLKAGAEGDNLWVNRSNILMRHIRRDSARQLATAGKRVLEDDGTDLPCFISTCRNIAFSIIQRAYWPLPTEMQRDLDQYRNERQRSPLFKGWEKFNMNSFPSGGIQARPLSDELAVAGA